MSRATVRHEVMGGEHWIELKGRLSYYENEQLANAGLQTQFEGGSATMGLDLPARSVLKMQLWLADWSFTDENGKSVSVSRDAIEALDARLGNEVEDAINTQEELVAAEIDEAEADTAIARHKAAITALEARKKVPTTPETKGDSK
ncbi:MAG: hypothetical protein ABIJ49_14315 [Pseudomonadota bacterium]